jgi:hypothetical protein
MTVAEWRAHPRRQPTPAPQCGHLYDTTTRYDHNQKLLHFLLICSVCDTETVIKTQPYEPRFTDAAPAGATVHQLPIPRHDLRLRHAA